MEAGAEVSADRQWAFARALAAEGLRMTHQRLEILREIAVADDHPDAETVFQRVRERVPTLSQDTVYRTLTVLVKYNLVDRVLMPRATRFDPDRKPHYHFICDQCGRLMDVGAGVVPSLPVPGILPGIGEVHSVHLEMWGLCDACRVDIGRA
jgi:Fur family transcriptional regulator, peroxide stress response regulator